MNTYDSDIFILQLDHGYFDWPSPQKSNLKKLYYQGKA